MACFFYIVLTLISTTSRLRSTGNTRKYQQIDVYIYQCDSLFSRLHRRRQATTFICYRGSKGLDLSLKVMDSEKRCKFSVCVPSLTLNVPIATKVVCFSRLLKCLRSLYGKQCGPRSVLGPHCLLLYLICQ